MPPEATSAASVPAAAAQPDVAQGTSGGTQARDAAVDGLAREVDQLLAVIAASLETARGQAEPGTPVRESLDRAAETLTQGSDRVRQLVALTRVAQGPHDVVAPEPRVEEAARPAAARVAGGRVVILDDEEPLVRVGKHLLKRLGHEATGFIHPREAIEAIERDPRGFDVLITDLTMPELSGHEVARAVAQIRSDLPIIVLSGRLQDDGDALGIPNPVYRLGKPYTRDQLQQVVEAALRGV